MNVLVVNAGSSSLKYQLIDMKKNITLAKGLCERIGIDGRISQSVCGREDYSSVEEISDHSYAVELALRTLTDKNHGAIEDLSMVAAVGHRVAHGGELFSGPVVIDDNIMKHMESVAHFTPLHSPPILTCIRASMEKLNSISHVGVFDTAFHHTIPPEAFLYAIPYKYYEEHRIRRYGFHGTSHRYVCIQAEKMLKRPLSELKIISCHLGNGSSVAAVKYGKSVDTSMGFTPLEGLPMGTRSGDIDPAIMENMASLGNKTAADVVSILNKESGILGLSGVSSDLRDVIAAADEGHERSKLALEVMAYRIKKYIGAYYAAMNGVDALIFTAGIGENSARLRAMVCADMDAAGISIDLVKNDCARGACDISCEGARAKTLVVPTNEEWMIASDTVAITKTDLYSSR